jgi:hypothetical protein
MSKAEQFMTSLQQQHLVVKVMPLEPSLASLIVKALGQFQQLPTDMALVASADNALELRPLRGAVRGLPAPFAAPMPQPDANDGTVLLVLAVPTNSDTDSY